MTARRIHDQDRMRMRICKGNTFDERQHYGRPARCMIALCNLFPAQGAVKELNGGSCT